MDSSEDPLRSDPVRIDVTSVDGSIEGGVLDLYADSVARPEFADLLLDQTGHDFQEQRLHVLHLLQVSKFEVVAVALPPEFLVFEFVWS